jgi:hypothetical protein
MKKFSYSTKKQSILNAIYVIRNYTQDQAWLCIVCRYFNAGNLKRWESSTVGQRITIENSEKCNGIKWSFSISMRLYERQLLQLYSGGTTKTT